MHSQSDRIIGFVCVPVSVCECVFVYVIKMIRWHPKKSNEKIEPHLLSFRDVMTDNNNTYTYHTIPYYT